MLSSSRFVVAIHVLCILAKHAGKGPVCSNLIANSVDTNPVVIRRLMSELERAKLVLSTAGRSGGFQLSKSPEDVSLADIYEAVEDATVFKMHRTDPDAECPIAAQMGKILIPKLRDAEMAMTASLRGTKLSHISTSFH
jgi:Rrf2 family protein